MANTYQAKHFTGEQLDRLMNKVLTKEIAGRGLEIDQDGTMHATVPGYATLVYSYTHTTNKEVYVTAIDFSTGILTSPGHGLSNNTMMVVTVDVPHNIGMPYKLLPGGLDLGDFSSNTATSTKYYVTVVDDDRFTLSTEIGGALVGLTSKDTMDLTKFHFEVMEGGMTVEIKDLNLKECLIVIRGKVFNSFRWVRPSNVITFDSGAGQGNRTGGVCYDTVFGTDNYGSCHIGRPGYNYTYSTLEIKTMGNQQAYQVNDNNYIVYSSASIPTFKHQRQYYHMQLTSDVIESIKMYGDTQGRFFNGATVEVYAK